ncbi:MULTISPECIES: anaerobic ribonucleoside-triphosphate reductase activating protein [Pseudothermotoga]|jgi:pyruvate formate lyase activating enzyme|nr:MULTISPECIES: anaerobic ribonucleoside-triphosphate reductase activating protein [Pseudothermotoga]KUK21027.1 MAG: Anaerobic ribonucleoside-triphosphate reductase activating protein [Pseudothermotoga lettingae]MDI3494220.1 pyruvate formate lyase activating enzyme [Pseudothermotoga sp.]MDK2884006.1 pyruvate formate lyase activating enzyme [Pseudothermotoga sp.]HBJ81058.1 anaerobic ribonucleoside-triphosphate reductase activating protein [Pseudothermotoga sp.]HBT25758.1 anaerobic ribonucleosi
MLLIEVDGPMYVQGWVKVSLLDFPKEPCSTVFISGCNLRCPYCHNSMLVTVDKSLAQTKWKEVLAWIKSNRKLINAVCITGGEPTLRKDLYLMIHLAKELGIKVKLDTNGTQPYIIEKLIRLKMVDFVAMDIKAPLSKYEKVCRASVDLDSIKRSVEVIRSLAPEYEFRTTYHPDLLSVEDFLEICKWLDRSSNYVLQRCRIGENLDPSFNKMPVYYSLGEIIKLLRNHFQHFTLRGFSEFA